MCSYKMNIQNFTIWMVFDEDIELYNIKCLLHFCWWLILLLVKLFVEMVFAMKINDRNELRFDLSKIINFQVWVKI